MNSEIFTPEPGRIYHNRGGGDFRCVTKPQIAFPYAPGDAPMQNIRTGWTFLAHGIHRYPGGEIEWDYASGGYWASNFTPQGYNIPKENTAGGGKNIKEENQYE